MDEWQFFNPKKNHAFGYCDTRLLLARREGRVVGRVMGIINRRVNEYRHENSGRFGFLESPDDVEVCHGLLGTIEAWARERGMGKVVGPMGFTDQDPEGLVIEGFGESPTIATTCNFPYIVGLVESAGYTKEVDYFTYKLDVLGQMPELHEKVCRRLADRGGYRMLEFKRRSELKPWVRPVLQLMNETFVRLYGYAPMDEAELDELARRYLPIIDPRFVKGVTKNDELLAFVIAMPNADEGLRRSGGHLFPFGFLHILAAMKRAKQLDLLLGGIKQEYRGRGLDTMLAVAMMREAREAGFEVIDTHHELESNTLVRHEMERLGGRVCKRLRILQKAL